MADETSLNEKALLILKPRDGSTQKAETYLRSRGWDVRTVTNVRDALALVTDQNFSPLFALIPVDHQERNVLMLPTILKSKCRTGIIAVFNRVPPNASEILDKFKTQYALTSPLSGPSIERMIAKIKLEAEAAEKGAGKDSEKSGEKKERTAPGAASAGAASAGAAMAEANANVTAIGASKTVTAANSSTTVGGLVNSSAKKKASDVITIAGQKSRRVEKKTKAKRKRSNTMTFAAEKKSDKKTPMMIVPRVRGNIFKTRQKAPSEIESSFDLPPTSRREDETDPDYDIFQAWGDTRRPGETREEAITREKAAARAAGPDVDDDEDYDDDLNDHDLNDDDESFDDESAAGHDSNANSNFNSNSDATDELGELSRGAARKRASGSPERESGAGNRSRPGFDSSGRPLKTPRLAPPEVTYRVLTPEELAEALAAEAAADVLADRADEASEPQELNDVERSSRQHLDRSRGGAGRVKTDRKPGEKATGVTKKHGLLFNMGKKDPRARRAEEKPENKRREKAPESANDLSFLDPAYSVQVPLDENAAEAEEAARPPTADARAAAEAEAADAAEAAAAAAARADARRASDAAEAALSATAAADGTSETQGEVEARPGTETKAPAEKRRSLMDKVLSFFIKPPEEPSSASHKQNLAHQHARSFSLFEEATLRALDIALSDQSIDDQTPATPELQCCIAIQSSFGHGYLMVVQDGTYVQFGTATFVERLRSELVEYLEKHGETITSENLMGLRLLPVETSSWAQRKAGFLTRAMKDGVHVAVGFFPTKEIAITAVEGERKDLKQISLSDFDGDAVVEFDVFLHLPRNNRYIRYTPPGGRFLNEQKTRLQERGVKFLHIKNEQVGALTKYRAQNFLNERISEYLNSMAQKAG